MTHPFWGFVEEDWAGYSSEIYFSHPFFLEKQVDVFLEKEADKTSNEPGIPPAKKELDELALLYKDFTVKIDTHISLLQEQAFERYKKYYADYYEDKEKSGDEALHIDSIEKHNPFIRDVKYLLLSGDKTVSINIDYALDSGQLLEFKFVNGRLENVGG